MQTEKYNLCIAQLGRDTLRVKCPIIQKINPGSHADANLYFQGRVWNATYHFYPDHIYLVHLDHRIDMSEVVNALETEFGIDEHKNTAG